jgi:inositol-pentakisphosphate 2-kinase
MHQYVKVKDPNNRIVTRSGYCPLDLFSASTPRIYTAVSNLLKTPQNNFRVYTEQKQLADDATSTATTATTATTTTTEFQLEKDLAEFCSWRWQLSSPTVEESKTAPVTFATFVTLLLEQAPLQVLLARIRQAQAYYDSLDVEGIYRVYQELAQRPVFQTLSTLQYSCVKILKFKTGALPPQNALQEALALHIAQETLALATDADLCTAVQEYLVAHTLKDLSVMVSVTPIAKTAHVALRSQTLRENEFLLDAAEQGCFLCSAVVVDLDTKEASNIPKYYKQDRAIHTHFQQVQQQDHNTSASCV